MPGYEGCTERDGGRKSEKWRFLHVVRIVWS